MNLQEAKVLITGGSSGIGYATAQLLQQQGAQVFICSRKAADVERVKSELSVAGTVCDVSQEDQVEQLVSTAISELGGLNVLVNNAGFGAFAPLTATSTEDFTKVWETNVRGAFFVGRAVAKHFVAQETGNLINIGSTAAKKGFANGTAYCASKFALAGMTECWRAELRPYNVRVTQLNPSEVITQFGSKLGFEPKNTERKLKPSEIAHTIASLLTLNDIGFVPELSVWATNP
ncbi:MAG: SDR family oxidoreductase [Salibacteraceae bacterium]